MLTGRAPFNGETISDTIAAILEREPDWTRCQRPPQPRSGGCWRNAWKRIPSSGLRDIGQARIELDDSLNDAREDSTVRSHGAWRRAIYWTCGAILAVLTGIGIAIGWQNSSRPAATALVTLDPPTRLTTDSGLSTDPSISGDGRLIAYASDRSGEGNLDIWVQQTAGGPPIRLTNDSTDDYEPSMSPDGSIVAFRSDRNGGGVYVMPTFGGNARLIASEGRGPEFSPDGKSIAFWRGGWLAARSVGNVRRAYIVPAEASRCP